jgi:hypothetical protein
MVKLEFWLLIGGKYSGSVDLDGGPDMPST